MFIITIIVSGFVELFSAPVEAYKRDGRVLRGVRRGASAFSNSTAVAALELSGRCFDWIDFAASLTHDMVSTSTTAQQGQVSRANRPADFREGISNAYGVVHDVSLNRLNYNLFNMLMLFRELSNSILKWVRRLNPDGINAVCPVPLDLLLARYHQLLFDLLYWQQKLVQTL